ncbi:hypothetical protein ACMYR3_04015 [Ampullimonas aquatilis]|uniref:hypothetical protein n=1 Tax=Ampullimonas aquatilis TaxID=1341549 RepID=UPI003C7708AC
MAISKEQLVTAASLIESASTVREAAKAIRLQLPGIMATVVDPMDMRDETPTLKLTSAHLFLAVSDGHCWTMTRDPEQASAFILTEA